MELGLPDRQSYPGSFRNLPKALRNIQRDFLKLSAIRARIHPKIRYPSGNSGVYWVMRNRWLWLSILFLVATGGGYWLARTAAPGATEPGREDRRPLARRVLDDTPMPEFRRNGQRAETMRSDDEALAAGAVANERVIAFASQEALEAFLKRAGSGVHVLGRLDALNALRIRISDLDGLAALLDGDEEVSMIFPVEIPMPGNVGAQPGAVPLGNQLLAWLGIDGLEPAGGGVRIAILDTGIFAHRSFSGNITTIDLVARPEDSANLNGHGTAVASMLAGSSRTAPGVVPLADLIDIRVANEFGASNSWLLAKGILAAVDAGAQIINISMGSQGDSTLVRSAIAYAQQSGVVIVAAAGNQGLDRVAYPAANEGVIAVGATDAKGNHVAFSNSGLVDVAAPGYGVNAAWPGDAAVNVDGTSFSAPIVAGSIAWIMSTQNVSATQAVVLMNRYLNDSGAAGPDAGTGGGLPALDRVAAGSTPGIFDAAVASHHVIPPNTEVPYPRVEVVVQNRGTETLINTAVTITHPGGTTTANITSLPPGGVQPVFVPISFANYESGQPLAFDSRVAIGQSVADANPQNDRRIDDHQPIVDP